MGKLDSNMITDGLSGRVGDTIYRQRRCGTVAYRSPRPYPQKTPCQLGQQSVFKKSSLLGKLALADPEKKAFFATLARKDQYIYNAAVSYYMTHAEEREKEFEKYFPQTRPERAAKKERMRGLHKELCIIDGPYVKSKYQLLAISRHPIIHDHPSILASHPFIRDRNPSIRASNASQHVILLSSISIPRFKAIDVNKKSL